MKIFADVADLKQMEEIAKDPMIAGFTTNPSLMRKAGITSYREFAEEVLGFADGRPVSFEVVADNFVAMAYQANQIAKWVGNIYVKIPITYTSGESTADLIHLLSNDGIKVNVTAVMTRAQGEAAAKALDTKTPSIISVFAGRIADTGLQPYPIVQSTVFAARLNTEVLWASTREVLNISEAQLIGCHIITLPPDLLAKRHLLGKNLDEYSLETVQQFYKDAQGYDI